MGNLVQNAMLLGGFFLCSHGILSYPGTPNISLLMDDGISGTGDSDERAIMVGHYLLKHWS